MYQHTKAAYTTTEFCKLFSIGKTKMYEEVKAGRLKLIKFGRKSLIKAEDASSWFEALCNDTSK